MPAPPPSQVAQFSDTLRALGVLFQRVAAEQSAAHGALGKQDLRALDVLGVRGPSRMGTLAEHLGVGRSAVTPLADRLEAAGLVRRRRSQADRRAWLVELTEEGEGVFEAERAAYERVARVMLAPLDGAERDTLRTLLDRVQAAVAESSEGLGGRTGGVRNRRREPRLRGA